jgi:folylpolyglutamate synthase
VLEFVGVNSALPTHVAALKPKVQRINCSLALAVVRAWLSVKAPKGKVAWKIILLVASSNFPGQGGISKSTSGIFNGFLMERIMN